MEVNELSLILKVVGWKMFTRKLLELKEIRESGPIAWELSLEIKIKAESTFAFIAF